MTSPTPNDISNKDDREASVEADDDYHYGPNSAFPDSPGRSRSKKQRWDDVNDETDDDEPKPSLNFIQNHNKDFAVNNVNIYNDSEYDNCHGAISANLIVEETSLEVSQGANSANTDDWWNEHMSHPRSPRVTVEKKFTAAEIYMEFDKFPVTTGKAVFSVNEFDISRSLTEDIADNAERKAKFNGMCNKHNKSNPK
jgi:hypothetical protein